MKNLSKDEKKYLGYYLGWTFIHIILFTVGWKGKYHDKFWVPLIDDGITIKKAYNITEFLIYVGTPAVAFYIHRLINSNSKK
jgi:hypothetical protein